MNNTLIDVMMKRAQENPEDKQIFIDILQLCTQIKDSEEKLAHETSEKMRNMVALNMSRGINPKEYYDIYRQSLLFDSVYSLDAYLLYLEQNRAPKDRFYQPRRGVLKRVVNELQKLADGEMNELFLSMPPRAGKTSLVAFFVSWLLGRDPERPNLYSSFTGIVTNAFYTAVLEILRDPDTYLWNEVFPLRKVASTNAAETTIDVDRWKHYHSLTCRSIDGTLNGACDASDGFIIGDDLVSGIEEALSKERLISKWAKVDNNLIPRGKGNSRYLWIGTRWSILDPEGIRLDLLENDPKYKNRKYAYINLPALDENDESNFDYPYGVGFNTEYYHQRRASFERNNDMASWLAQYMGEPIEREGTLFTPNDFRYYNGVLPEGEPDRVFMAVDPAYGGGDFVASPVCVQYGEDVYVPGVVYDNGDKKVTIPLIAKSAKKYGVTMIQVEVNQATLSYKEELAIEIKNSGYKATLTSKNSSSQTNKQQRIFDKAPDIRERFIFLEPGCRPKEYAKFMENVFNFKMFLSKTGLKKQHDDAPDSLAQAADMIVHPSGRYTIFKSPF